MHDDYITLRATFDLGAPPGDVPPVEDLATEPPEVVASTDTDPKTDEAIRFCVGIDFDSTLCRSAWPGIGAEMPGASDFLRWLAERDWWRVLWTCRTGKPLDAALAWLAERGFSPDWWAAINATPQPITDLYGHDSRKIGCHAFIDDLAIGFPTQSDDTPDWDRIKSELEERAADWRASSAKE
jgi:hypothetical protein